MNIVLRVLFIDLIKIKMISVILSTNNEIRNNYLEQLLESIKNQDTKYELIIIDNWSTDNTLEICKKYTDDIYELKKSNRAQRLNLWLEKSSWDIILFNHPVSVLPNNVFSKIEDSINNGNKWGGLTHSFDSNNLLLKFTSWYSNNIRWKIKSIIYLDHCIFVESNLAKNVWWFPDVEIFEDTLFSYNLSKISKWIILPYKIITSARRFTKRWIFKQSLLNQYLKIMFHLKASDKWMNKMYEEKEWFNVNYKK